MKINTIKAISILFSLFLLSFIVSAQSTISTGEEINLETGTYQVSDYGEIEITNIEGITVTVNGGSGEGGISINEERYGQVRVGESDLYLINCEVSENSFKGAILENANSAPVEDNCETRFGWEIENKETGETATNGEVLEVSSGQQIGLKDSQAARRIEKFNGGIRLISIRDVNAAEDKTIYPGYTKSIYFYQGTGYSATRDQGINFFVCEVTDNSASLVPYEFSYDEFNDDKYNNCLNNLRERTTINLDLQESRPIFTGLEPTTLNINYPEGSIQKQIDLDQRAVSLDNNLYSLIKNPTHSTAILGDPANIKLGNQLFLQGEFHRDGETRLIYQNIDNPNRNFNWQVTGSGFYFIHGNLRYQVHHEGESTDIYMTGSGPSEDNSYTSASINANGETLFSFCGRSEDNYETVNGIQIFRTSSPPNVGCDIKDFSIKTRDADNNNYGLMRKYEDKNFDLDSNNRITIYRGGKYRLSGIDKLSPLTKFRLENVGDNSAQVSLSDQQLGIFFDKENCGYRSGNLNIEQGTNIGIPEENVFLQTAEINTNGIHNVVFEVLNSKPSQLNTPNLNQCTNDNNDNEDSQTEDSSNQEEDNTEENQNIDESDYLPIEVGELRNVTKNNVYEFTDISGYFMVEDITETGIESNPYKINILKNSQEYESSSEALFSVVEGSKTDQEFDGQTYWFYNCESTSEETSIIIYRESKSISNACNNNNPNTEQENTSETEEQSNTNSNNLTLSSETLSIGNEITINTEVTPELSETGYKIVVSGPENTQQSYENQIRSSLRFRPETPGVYNVHLKPKSLLGNVPLVGNLLAKGSVVSKNFTVSGSESNNTDTAWRNYCQEEYGNSLEDSKQCIENDIIPEYFEDSIGSNPEIAESICSDIVSKALGSEYTYNEASRQCARE